MKITQKQKETAVFFLSVAAAAAVVVSDLRLLFGVAKGWKKWLDMRRQG